MNAYAAELDTHGPAKILKYHYRLLSDRMRTRAFKNAINHIVKPGQSVLDIGAGTGFLSFLCVKAGAARVYAVEHDDVISLARLAAHTNKMDSKVYFLKRHSTKIKLPCKMDLIVTETIGNSGLDEGIVASVIDARKKWLKPKGRIIPSSMELYAAPVELSSAYRRVSFWKKKIEGIDLSGIHAHAVNSPYRFQLTPRALLSPGKKWADINFLKITNDKFEKTLIFRANRSGRLSGFGIWFRAELAPKIWVANTPSTRSSWYHFFLPLSKPVSVKKGEHLKVRIRSAMNGSLWEWRFADKTYSNFRTYTTPKGIFEKFYR